MPGNIQNPTGYSNQSIYNDNISVPTTGKNGDSHPQSKIATNIINISNASLELPGIYERMDALSLKNCVKENHIREIVNGLTQQELSQVVYLRDLEKFRSLTEPSNFTKALTSNSLLLVNNCVSLTSGLTWLISALLKEGEISIMTNAAAGGLAVVSTLLTAPLDYFSRYNQNKQKTIEDKCLALAGLLMELRKDNPHAMLPLHDTGEKTPLHQYDTGYIKIDINDAL